MLTGRTVTVSMACRRSASPRTALSSSAQACGDNASGNKPLLLEGLLLLCGKRYSYIYVTKEYYVYFGRGHGSAHCAFARGRILFRIYAPSSFKCAAQHAKLQVRIAYRFERAGRPAPKSRNA